MRGRKPEPFRLKPMDQSYLRDLLCDGQTPLKIAQRAPILLGRTDAEQRICWLGEKVEQDRATI